MSTTRSAPPTAAPSGRAPLTRARAVAAAVALADEHGLGALTMRRLAADLGVEAMSLYHHVANKEDLLDAMVDTVFAEIDLAGDEADWQVAMQRRATSMRAALARHAWAIALMDSRSAPGPATLRHHDAVIGTFLRAGFPVALAAHAFSVLDSYVFGFALQEANLPFAEGDDLSEMVSSILPPEMASTYPNLATMAEEVVLQPGYRYADEFDFGLGLVLDALAAVAGPPRRRPRRAAGSGRR